MLRFALALLLLAAPAAADPLAGLWRTVPPAGGPTVMVRIAPCGAALCGTIEAVVGPDGRLRPERHRGRLLLWDVLPIGADTWRARAYAATRDQDYAAFIRVEGDRLGLQTCVLGRCGAPDLWLRLR
jgi:uncharacterized protein (DUF2147 family)